MSNVTIKFQEEKEKKYSLPLYVQIDEYLYQIIEMNDYYYLLSMNNGSIQFGYKTTTIEEMLTTLKNQNYSVADVHINVNKSG